MSDGKTETPLSTIAEYLKKLLDGMTPRVQMLFREGRARFRIRDGELSVKFKKWVPDADRELVVESLVMYMHENPCSALKELEPGCETQFIVYH